VVETRSVGPRSDRRADVAAAVALVLGTGHAAVSAYWLAGGTALLDTLGESLEEWARDRSATASAAVAAVVIVKLVTAALGPLVAAAAHPRAPGWLARAARWRVVRPLAWVAAAVLVLYGGLLTAVGLAVEAGIVSTAPDADERALAWHAWLWDPWFLAWGLALTATLWWTRPARA
jgi:hypothetical protein